MATIKVYTKTRGFRNNNPGNIRHGEAWLGLKRRQRDRKFCQFISMKYGIRAMFHILWTYQDAYQLYTINDIIMRWAPPSENNTKAYIKNVTSYVKSCKCLANTSFNQNSEILDNEQLTCVVGGIIFQENGIQPFNHDFIFDCQEREKWNL